MIIAPVYRKLISAIAWLAFVSYLFCLPGSALPSTHWLSSIGFDKMVHIGIFIGIVFLWCRALRINGRKTILLTLVMVLMYGLLVEMVQDKFIPNRSFDWYDWLADFAGSLIGLRLWKGYIKNKPL